MLKLRFSVEPKGMAAYTIAPEPIPCTPADVLHVRVSFAGMLSQAMVWYFVHTEENRPNSVSIRLRLIAIVVGVISTVCLILWWAPFGGSGTGSTSSGGKALGPLAGRIKELLIFGLPLLIAGAWVMKRLRPALIDFYIVALRPHEPFPSVEQFLARERDKQVYAIRFLSDSTHARFFERVLDQCRQQPFEMNSVGVTHAGIPTFAPHGLATAVMGYWSIVRLGIGLLVEEHAESKARAIGFSYKQHEWLLMGYFVLLTVALLVPAFGLTPANDDSQFPLLMSGLGFFWAGVFLLVNRGMSSHLAEWERRTANAPFMGCPMFRYSERDVVRGCWEPVDLKAMEAPIRQMGLPGDKVLELALSVMLILYLTVLQLIK